MSEISFLNKKISNLKAVIFLLKKQMSDYSYVRKTTETTLMDIRDIVSKRLEPEMSGMYLVFNEFDGVFTDPLIVTADGIEEALMPEDESYMRDFAMPIPDISTFKDV